MIDKELLEILACPVKFQFLCCLCAYCKCIPCKFMDLWVIYTMRMGHYKFEIVSAPVYMKVYKKSLLL